MLKTDLKTSLWADQSLFFKHDRVRIDRRYWNKPLWNLEEDIRFDQQDPDNQFCTDKRRCSDRSEQLAQWPDESDVAKQLFMDHSSQHGCPFAWLLGLSLGA